jgi:hypothetical protein
MGSGALKTPWCVVPVPGLSSFLSPLPVSLTGIQTPVSYVKPALVTFVLKSPKGESACPGFVAPLWPGSVCLAYVPSSL